MQLKLLWEDANNRKWIIFFGLFVVGLIVLLAVQQNSMEQQIQLKVQFIEEKNMLRDDLDDLIDEHDDLLYEYGDLNEQLHNKDSIIQQQISEIRNLIRTKSDLRAARQKIESLKSISKRYLADIDSLFRVNEQLSIQNDSVIKVNQDINWKNYKLNKQNRTLSDKVHKGSVLEVYNVQVEAVHYRNTGKQVPTRYAKKVQSLRICCDIAANQIAEAEQKTIYFQLLNDKGETVMGKDTLCAEVNTEELFCTSLSIFNYENEEMTHCLEWERVQILLKGNYLINLIIDGKIAAQANLKLR